MGRDAGRPARVATYILMALTYAACEVASTPDDRPRGFGVAFGVGLFLVAVAVGYLLPRPATARTSTREGLLLGLVLVLPLAAEPLLRKLSGEGSPLELQLVNGLRTLGLALAGLSAWRQFRRLAGVVALFLALFASAMGDQPAVPYLLVAFAVTGGVWLVLEHRASVGTSPASTIGVLADRVALRVPYREAVVFALLAAAAGAVAFAGPQRVMLTLGELMPTSGGTGDTDPFARYGVGDGPEETAGENAKAAGMVDTDKMIEDNKNALIDAVNDMYGPPHKPPKEQERTVAAGKADVIENHGKLPENRRPSRDFDTGRKGPKSDRKPESRGARGLFEVEGRTPLHVRVVAYDSYDATAARWREARKPSAGRLEPEADDWMKLNGFKDGVGWYARDERHRLKVADLKDNLVPTPALLTRVRINKVDRPDYYEWDFEGVLALAGRKRTPPGVVVATDCRTLAPASLPEKAFAGHNPSPLCAVPPELEPEFLRLATEWAGGVPRGWRQVEAVLARLRGEYTPDPAATAPPDHPAPVLWFLQESRRGPDYLFATSAALLLRTLGYPTRVCLGYYAAPENFDPETDHTPVRSTDLHVWPEVRLSDGQWLVVEPTPGYAVLAARRSWGERLAAAAAAFGAWAGRNAVGLGAAFASLGLLAWRRKMVADRIHTALWRLWPGRTWREVVLRAVRVIERRGQYAGRPRATNQTLAAWVGSLTAGQPAAGLDELVGFAEWAAYGPGLPLPVPEAEVLPLCRRVLAAWTVRRMTPGRPRNDTRPTA